ncbi:MAG: nucleotide exchange factor GrpE [Patescibacteria group bacterium]
MRSNEENEIVPEDLDDSVVLEEASQASIKKLKEHLKECEGKAKEYLDGWQRAQADFVNLRKRDEEAKVEFLKFANADLIVQLIPVLDSLNLAESHAEPIYKQLLQILKQNGLEESNPAGETFDPRKHESIGVIKTDKKEEDHKVLEVVQKGYILSGKIIRPAKVKIGEYKE